MVVSSFTPLKKKSVIISHGDKSTVRNFPPLFFPILTAYTHPFSPPAHINNLYNTTFHALIQHANHSSKSAHETLRGTASSAKHEILFSRFGINYNELPLRFRKGSVLVREVRRFSFLCTHTLVLISFSFLFLPSFSHRCFCGVALRITPAGQT